MYSCTELCPATYLPYVCWMSGRVAQC